MTRCLIAAWIALPLFSQVRVGGMPPPRPVSPGTVGHGFGSVVFPATGVPHQTPATGHIQSLSATVAGRVPQSYGGYRRGVPAGSYAYPVAMPYYGYGYGGYGYGGYGYPAGYSGEPNVTIINQAPPQPSVIINQTYTPERAQPVMRDYTNDGALPSYQAPIPDVPEGRKGQLKKEATNEDRPTIYLVAMKDGAIYPALAYWVESGSLHYITTKHAHNQASLDLVDSKFSEQLNRERGLEFAVRGKASQP